LVRTTPGNPASRRLTQRNLQSALLFIDPKTPQDQLPNLYKVNDRYEPWGGNPSGNSESTTITGCWAAAKSPTTGITVILWWSATVTSGNVAWLLSLERMDAALDIDADSFGATTAAGVVTVPGTSGFPLSHTQAITKGTNMDSVVAGDLYRLKVVRDAATDTAAGTVELLGVEVRET
jgi:hypothetical protein